MKLQLLDAQEGMGLGNSSHAFAAASSCWHRKIRYRKAASPGASANQGPWKLALGCHAKMHLSLMMPNPRHATCAPLPGFSLAALTLVWIRSLGVQWKQYFVNIEFSDGTRLTSKRGKRHVGGIDSLSQPHPGCSHITRRSLVTEQFRQHEMTARAV